MLGQGNVAIDVARILLTPVDDLMVHDVVDGPPTILTLQFTTTCCFTVDMRVWFSVYQSCELTSSYMYV